MAVNAPARYTARMEESVNIAEDVAYERLSTGILEFTVRAAIARSEDESEWEHEELRRRGLGGIQIFRIAIFLKLSSRRPGARNARPISMKETNSIRPFSKSSIAIYGSAGGSPDTKSPRSWEA
jgi:hypothetical protein